ncbi:Uma2 family endonuclease [Alkalinema pantanalense CENA528]|uniref:Uma2 family endonuclease n=1 Tax=Alkalinema pantanalense TaxID=1620705 RepID=UPI003D6DD2DC
MAGEEQSLAKHEYVDGAVYAVDSASDTHATITFNLPMLLIPHIRKQGCRGYGANMKTHVPQRNTYYYADFIVTCDPRDRETDYFKTHPKLVVEILSPSTEAYDRGKKFETYRELDSLEEYVLVSQDRMLVEIFRRNAQNRWELYAFHAEDELELASIDFRCPVTALYEDVIFPPPAPEPSATNL